MKEIYVLGGLVLFLAVVVAGFWYYSQTDEAAHSNQQVAAMDQAQVSRVLRSQMEPTAVGVTPVATAVDGASIATHSTDVLHDDIFFEIGRKGLTDEAKAALHKYAEFLTQEADWGVLVQGYTDQQGSAAYNKILGHRRADSVKQQLMALGVSETAIRTVSLGEEGALCIDQSDTCRRINRRVHLELRKVGQSHMTIPPVLVPARVNEQPPDVETTVPLENSPLTSEDSLPPTTSSMETLPAGAQPLDQDSSH
jgi:peptidoglycan-associated lipoprotein